MNNDSPALRLPTLLGDYSNTAALKRGEVRSPTVVFDFADVKVPNTAFKDVVRHLKYDVAELAIVTFLQAKASGKPLMLLPAVVVGSVPHPFLVYNAERGRITPGDLAGRRVGIRAYSVTTAAWIRGILQNDHGVDLDERAPAGKQLVKMLLDGEIEAGVVGGPDLNDPRLRPVITNPSEAAQVWCRKNGALPINHMAVVKESLRQSNPAAVREIFRMLRESKQVAPAPVGVDTLQFGVEKIRLSLELIIEYSVQQKLIPKRVGVDELFDEVTRELN